MSLIESPTETAERKKFYDKIDNGSYTALWTVLSSIITPEPRSQCQSHLWHFDEAKSYLLEAGGLITAKEAERRVIVLENPGLRGQSRITTSLYAGLQIVMPGEVAPAHRHSQSALRFVMDGSGAHTAVDGERTNLEFGDFVITPAGAWHDHGNHSSEPMIWLDGLDIPIVSVFDASFAEEHHEDEQPITRQNDDTKWRFASNMLPLDYERARLSSPIFNYPYARSREALENLKKQGELDPCHGIKMRYVNPVDGGWAMPTMSTCLQLLPKGFKTHPYRSTDATVFVVTEGKGSSTIAGKTYEWGAKDIFVVPSWHTVVHEAESEAVMFSYSDRVCQEKLDLWREDRGNNVPL